MAEGGADITDEESPRERLNTLLSIEKDDERLDKFFKDAKEKKPTKLEFGDLARTRLIADTILVPGKGAEFQVIVKSGDSEVTTQQFEKLEQTTSLLQEIYGIDIVNKAQLKPKP
jgi:hypothetical protein